MTEITTRIQFLQVMRTELAKYPWAAEAGRLDRTMASVEGTMNGDRRCIIDGASWLAAWKAIGRKGKPTYKALHALFGKDSESPAVRCDQCAACMIQGVFCHETGCPNTYSRYEDGVWIKQRKCDECGCSVDAEDLCCDAEVEDDICEECGVAHGANGCEDIRELVGDESESV